MQLAPHRPEQGSTIKYQNRVWTVELSTIHNPNITIVSGKQRQHLPWATTAYTVIRTNTAQDHDLRENDLGALPAFDAYAGLSDFQRRMKIRQKYADAKRQALVMVKNRARPSVNQASEASLDALRLENFEVTRRGPTLDGSFNATEAAEWQMTWIEGSADNPRRTWTFVIDVDNPLSTSSQDPHVGWTVSAAPGSQPAVANTFGHVWLDHVPVMRT